MSAVLNSPPAALGFAELEMVTIVHDTKTDEGKPVRAGTRGTIVGVWSGGAAYEVEFVSPAGTATIKRENLRSAPTR